ncbi:hypothetical protein HYH03_001774 [Edaphochlamys debaryana]|uniref:Uncharacterized protein n=1 Tax=Edaphochlamys debaryana TaxID=47281 RepID=A0A835YM38_9CHLO|nr:hypothetical protein HYH03_001774 [Edaphochlamys debaryana]|eukprot:KAG2500194.1 hypothetical protein HYH03_001774 [Edaphochlamys debaryana]
MANLLPPIQAGGNNGGPPAGSQVLPVLVPPIAQQQAPPAQEVEAGDVAASRKASTAIDDLVKKWEELTDNKEELEISDPGWQSFVNAVGEVILVVGDAFNAAPMGVGMVAKSAQILLQNLRQYSENKKLVMLLAVDVAMVCEMFSGIRAASEDNPDRRFYDSAAGRIHTLYLQRALAEAASTIGNIGEQPGLSVIRRVACSLMRCCLSTSDSTKLEAAREQLELARGRFCQAIMMQPMLSQEHRERVANPVGSLANRLVLSYGDDADTRMYINPVTGSIQPVTQLRAADILADNPQCMAWMGGHHRQCKAEANRAYLVRQSYPGPGGADGGPWVICVCSQYHDRANGWLASKGIADGDERLWERLQ